VEVDGRERKVDVGSRGNGRKIDFVEMSGGYMDIWNN
jgi:hypothetical protein